MNVGPPVRRVLLVLSLVVSLFAVGPLSASTNGSGGSKPVHVKGYTKKDGTHVRAHDRKAPKEHASKAPKTPKTRTPKISTSSSGSASPDEKGRIQRSEAAKHTFARRTGYPNGRPGYVIDHIVPLACGGTDAPSNMQWQTIEAAKAKDRTERETCR